MKCLFVYNPKSGKSGLVKRIDYIKKELSKIYEEVDYLPTEYKGHAEKIARESCGNYDYLIVSGGDGTFNEIINGVAEQENAPVIGYLPSGTVNDISRSLRISRNLKKSLNILRDNNVFSHDLFKANSRYGVYFCGSGAFTGASYGTKQTSKKMFGKIAYFFHGAKELTDIPDFDVKITDKNGKTTSGKYVLMLIVNSRSVSGFKLNSHARLNDGKVDIVLIKRKNTKWYNYLASLITIAKVFLFDIRYLKNGKHHDVLSLDEFTLKNNKRMIINVDGEKSSYGNMKFKVIKEGFKVIVPSKTIKQQFKLKYKDNNEQPLEQPPTNK